MLLARYSPSNCSVCVVLFCSIVFRVLSFRFAPLLFVCVLPGFALCFVVAFCFVLLLFHFVLFACSLWFVCRVRFFFLLVLFICLLVCSFACSSILSACVFVCCVSWLFTRLDARLVGWPVGLFAREKDTTPMDRRLYLPLSYPLGRVSTCVVGQDGH